METSHPLVSALTQSLALLSTWDGQTEGGAPPYLLRMAEPQGTAKTKLSENVCHVISERFPKLCHKSAGFPHILFQSFAAKQWGPPRTRGPLLAPATRDRALDPPTGTEQSADVRRGGDHRLRGGSGIIGPVGRVPNATGCPLPLHPVSPTCRSGAASAYSLLNTVLAAVTGLPVCLQLGVAPQAADRRVTI
ncbi:hypothetical protein CBR_g23316 [Chara braunii]|uniref:Uncharacterized protein n=1 Tax=Chara braunii TaxID=69332 RepID=A0A388L3U6_CHABU|nr:hypothetical protein CBR_g23316 [Chara braunii]|eukprot:GBG76985.1 hypothetical protein CBR_g23316 [Chara braunii]